MDSFHSIGIDYSNRTISKFCYSKERIPLWKTEFTVNKPRKVTTVTVPSEKGKEVEVEEIPEEFEDQRESIKIQALVAKIGAEMGFTIWLPKSDRIRVQKIWNAGAEYF